MKEFWTERRMAMFVGLVLGFGLGLFAGKIVTAFAHAGLSASLETLDIVLMGIPGVVLGFLVAANAVIGLVLGYADSLGEELKVGLIASGSAVMGVSIGAALMAGPRLGVIVGVGDGLVVAICAILGVGAGKTLAILFSSRVWRKTLGRIL